MKWAVSFGDFYTRSSAEDFLFDVLEEFFKAPIAQKFQPFNLKGESVGLGRHAGGLFVHKLFSNFTANLIIHPYTPKVSRQIAACLKRVLGALGVRWEHGEENASGGTGVPPERRQGIRESGRGGGGPEHDGRRTRGPREEGFGGRGPQADGATAGRGARR